MNGIRRFLEGTGGLIASLIFIALGVLLIAEIGMTGSHATFLGIGVVGIITWVRKRLACGNQREIG